MQKRALWPVFYGSCISRYIAAADALLTLSSVERTSTFSTLLPRFSWIMSPIFTWYPAFCSLPFTRMQDSSHASLATVLRLISLETFRYLSNRIFSSCVSEKPLIRFSISYAAVCPVSLRRGSVSYPHWLLPLTELQLQHK